MVLSRRHILATGTQKSKFSLIKDTKKTPELCDMVSLTLCSAQHQKVILAKGENLAHLPTPQSEPGQCLPAISWRWRCSLVENAFLIHLWTFHGTPTLRSLWDQCIPLSLKTAAPPPLVCRLLLMVPACWIIILCQSVRSPQHFSLTSLRCHLTALHIVFSFLGS